MQDAVRRLIDTRKARALRIILTAKDDLVDGRIPAEDAEELRSVIVEQVNDLFHVLAGLLETTSENVLLNEMWLAKLEERIYAVVRAPADARPA